MPKFETNVSATHGGAKRALETAEQLKRNVSEIGLYIAATGDPRVAILHAIERDVASAIDGLLALRRFTQDAGN